MEYVNKGLLIPFLDVTFKDFKIMLKLIHTGASDRRGALPPFLEFLMEVRLEEPKFLKSEWSTRVDSDIFPSQTYGPVVQPCRWHDHLFEVTTNHHERF